MTKKKLIIIVLVVLVGGGYGAYTFLAPKPAVAKLKVTGEIYVLPKGFTFNLTGGHYATMTVALVLGATQSDGSSGAGAGATTTPAGFGTLTEEPVIRDIITNIVTGQSSATLISTSGRAHLKAQIMTAIAQQSDVKVTEILFTDVAVQ
ncbi:MAG: flagellar basal body-associated FliL family protein [Solirubrobacteraceae bacterium]